jgi:fructuronate reductase
MTAPVRPRLAADTPLPPAVAGPRVVPEGVGIVHLGWGAFHRAHQAIYTQDAMDTTGDRRWGILGAVGRSWPVVDTVRPQQGRYTVLTTGLDDAGAITQSARVVGSVVDVAYPGTETPRLIAALAAPTTHVVTLTITEKGYCRRTDGDLDRDAAAADIRALRLEESAADRGPEPATTTVGLLVRGLAARRRADGLPVTVLSCDNMPENGRVLAGVVGEFVDAALPGPAGDPLRDWLRASVAFPGSMVDRITPATTPAVLDRVAELIGARDEAAVAAEPFRQWVIENTFAGPRPAWELAGAELTDDVVPWENAKLRMLNGTHSLLAYAGRVAGHTSIAEAVDDPEIASHARCFMLDEALPTLAPPTGADLRSYGEQLLRRFANPATGHTTEQVSTDGTQKIPIRWGPVIAWHLARGRVPDGVAYGLAAWTEFVRRAVRDGVDLGDPAGAGPMTDAVRRAGVTDAAGVAAALLALPGLLPENTGSETGLVDAVVRHATALAAGRDGAAAIPTSPGADLGSTPTPPPGTVRDPQNWKGNRR